MNQEFYDAVEANPVIAAVKSDAGLQAAVEMEEIQVIFVLYGDVCTIPEILERIKAAGKKAMVHIDLIAGLSAKEISVEFIAIVVTSSVPIGYVAFNVLIYTVSPFRSQLQVNVSE